MYVYIYICIRIHIHRCTLNSLFQVALHLHVHVSGEEGGADDALPSGRFRKIAEVQQNSIHTDSVAAGTACKEKQQNS